MDMATGMDMGMVNKPAAKAHALRVLLPWGLACLSPLAFAQVTEEAAPAPKPAFSMVSRVSVTETWTDNVNLSSAKKADQITEISPGLRMDVNKARLKGFFDYALTGASYAQSSSPGRTTNALASNMTLEAVDNTFFIDASGSISQQAISAFGTQSTSTSSVNSNNAEVSTYRVSPYVQGNFAGMANYLGRYSRTVTSGGPTGDVATNDASFGLKGGNGQRYLGWSADVTHQDVSYSAGRSTDNDTAVLGLNYAVTPQINVSVEAGSESNNFTSLDRQTNSLTGFGFTWTPSEVTKLTASGRHHAYGDTYQVSFDRRTSRTVWHFSDTKDITQTPNRQGTMSLGSAYDLFYAQAATLFPDPVIRAQYVTAYLQAIGIPPGATVGTGFTASSLTMQRRQDASFALLGVRDTITFIATQTESNRFDALTTAVDDFSTATLVRQSGLSVNLAHRLTPDYSLALLLSQVATTGSVSSQSNTLRSVNLNLTGKVGLRSNVTLGFRHSESDSSLTPYSETAVTGTFKLQF